jgi:hypothetical protein
VGTARPVVHERDEVEDPIAQARAVRRRHRSQQPPEAIHRRRRRRHRQLAVGCTGRAGRVLRVVMGVIGVIGLAEDVCEKEGGEVDDATVGAHIGAR